VDKNKPVPEDYAPRSSPQLAPEGGRAIKSTRIRTARNLVSFKFISFQDDVIFVFFSIY
jgi:hypothetical protein